MAETLTDSQILALCAYLNKTVNDTGSTLGPAATSDYLKWHATINSSPMMGMPIETADFAKSIFGRIPRKLLNDLANQGGLTRLEAGGLSLAELIAAARNKKSQVTGDEPAQCKPAEATIDLTNYVPLSKLMETLSEFKTSASCGKFLNAHKDEIRQYKPSKNRRLVHVGDWHRY